MFRTLRLRRRLLLHWSCCLVVVVACVSAAVAAAAATAEAAAAEAQWLYENETLGYQGERTSTATEETLFYGDGATMTAADSLSDLYAPNPESVSDDSPSASDQNPEATQETALETALAAATVALAALQDAESEAVEQAFKRANAMIKTHRDLTLQRALGLLYSALATMLFVAYSGFSTVSLTILSVIAAVSTVISTISIFLHLRLVRINSERLRALREAYDSGSLDYQKMALSRNLVSMLSLPVSVLQSHGEPVF